MKIGVVIPVYNSDAIIDTTIARVVGYFEGQGWDFDLVLVDDHSKDGVWAKIKAAAEADPRIKAISLVKNSGQHIANIAGFHFVDADCVVTMDDDLQNPPEEIGKLVAAWQAGSDFVCGRFETKQHAGFRKIGTHLMRELNQRIFDGPPGFIYSNFRLLDRAVIERIKTYETQHPYTTGLAMMFSRDPVNVLVRHDKRQVGQSNYTLRKLLRLAWLIVFNYSPIAVQAVMSFGIAFATLLLVLASYFLIGGLFGAIDTPGWASLGLLIAVSNMVTLIFLSLIASYLGIIISHLRAGRQFYVKEAVGVKDPAL